MKLEEKILIFRNNALASGASPVAATYQGVTKERIAIVLAMIARESRDTIDAVFALLDDETDSWFSGAQLGTKFCEGASTAHIGCHIGILQRGKTKLDREGRDYWIKPLRDIGAIEAVTMMPDSGKFVMGHVVAKSSNSAYRLAQDFVVVLKTPVDKLDSAVRAWISDDAIRTRLEVQARLAVRAREAADTKHSDLISAACDGYVPRFLAGYEIVYVDDGDGDRVPEAARRRLDAAGLNLILEDAMPDVLLWNRESDAFWIIEVVTSDGEVDLHKVNQTRRFISRTKPSATVGFTTAYRTWKEVAARQGREKNIAPGTYMWILEDASKQFYVESFDERRR